MPIRLLATPATTMPMQKARNAACECPATRSAAATWVASMAAAISPAPDSASDHGSCVQSGEASEASSSRPIAT